MVLKVFLFFIVTGTSIYSRPCLLLPPLNNVLDTDRVSLKTKLFSFFILSPPSPITPHPPFSLGLVHRHLVVSLFMDHWRKNIISGTKNVWLKGTPGKEAWVLLIQMKWIADTAVLQSVYGLSCSKSEFLKLWKYNFECCHFVSGSLCHWCHEQGQCLWQNACYTKLHQTCIMTFEKMW